MRTFFEIMAGVLLLAFAAVLVCVEKIEDKLRGADRRGW